MIWNNAAGALDVQQWAVVAISLGVALLLARAAVRGRMSGLQYLFRYLFPS